jgi:hypothetical protein
MRSFAEVDNDKMPPTLSPTEIEAVRAADKMEELVYENGARVAVDGHNRRLFASGGEASFRSLWEQALLIRKKPSKNERNGHGHNMPSTDWKEKARQRLQEKAVEVESSEEQQQPKKPKPPAAPAKMAATAAKVAAARVGQSAAKLANPCRPGSQLAQAFDLLTDGRLHEWEEFRAINPKYPKDPAANLSRDPEVAKHWTIIRGPEGAQMVAKK